MGTCSFYQNVASICKDQKNTVQIDNKGNISVSEKPSEINVFHTINYLGNSTCEE